MVKKTALLVLSLLFLTVLWTPKACAAENQEKEIYEKSGAQSMYDALDEEARQLLSKVGVDSGKVNPSLEMDGFFNAVSSLLRDKLTGPIAAMAALLGIILLCRLANCFENSDVGDTATLVGTLACASVILSPVIQLISSVKLVIESASIFMLAAIPVYSGLMIASGEVVAGSSYGLLTLATANAIPAFAAAVILPLLSIFLAFAISSSISQSGLDKLVDSMYRFAKWGLVLLVTLFSGILSIQTLMNLQVDSASGKVGKLIASSAIPIVGGAFGDAVALIKSSMQIVKSGVGAFGVLASLCIFLPCMLESVLWLAVCSAGEILCDLFHTPKLGKFLSTCSVVLKMILAVLISTAVVSTVCAAVILFVKGSG